MKIDLGVVAALVAALLVVACLVAPLAVIFWKDALAYQPQEVVCKK